MITISELSCYGNNGKLIHGTAAILHRMFTKEDTRNDHDVKLKEYKALIQKLGYAHFDEE